jgi:hypothetical protein
MHTWSSLYLSLRGAAVLFATIATLSAPAANAECIEDSLALRWIEVIERQDWGAMAAMLAADATYHDPTMAYYDRPEIELTGPEAIAAFWREASDDSGTSVIDYTIANCFETGPMAVLTLNVAVTVSGAFWGVDHDQITLRGAQTTVLRIAEGKIRSATDLVDYAGVTGQVEALQAQYGAVPIP